jgi:hypothetical protein
MDPNELKTGGHETDEQTTPGISGVDETNRINTSGLTQRTQDNRIGIVSLRNMPSV